MPEMLHKSISQQKSNKNVCVQEPIGGMETHFFCCERGQQTKRLSDRIRQSGWRWFPALVSAARKAAVQFSPRSSRKIKRVFGFCLEAVHFIITSMPKHRKQNGNQNDCPTAAVTKKKKKKASYMANQRGLPSHNREYISGFSHLTKQRLVSVTSKPNENQMSAASHKLTDMSV